MREISMPKRLILSAWLILAAVLCITFAAPRVSAPDFTLNQKLISSVDERIDTVLELTAASSAASIAVSVLPDDTATPIADKLADFGSYFLIVLCMLYLEKYLVTLIGYSVFTFVFPAALLALILWIAKGDPRPRRYAVKLGLFGLLLLLLIPTTIGASNMVYRTQQGILQQTLDNAGDLTLEVEDGSEAENSSAGNEGIVTRVFQKISSVGAEAIGKAKRLVNGFIEALAVMIVSSCLIPILIVIIYLKLIEHLFSFRLPPVPYMPGPFRRNKPHAEQSPDETRR